MANRKLYKILNKIKNRLPMIQKLNDEALREKTNEFKKCLAKGSTAEDILPEAFAVVCEAARRILGMMPYDCQILGAIALHYCYLAEMNTGEGKTLTATMPLYLNALSGKSCILVTANEYLAIRDAEEMGPIYDFLGITVRAGAQRNFHGHIPNAEKKEIYQADIVYTTHSILGFDYLLNNLVSRAEDRFLREFCYVIIDEADSVLLDAAQMPLVISGAPLVQSNLYAMADFFVTTLEKDRDYIEEKDTVWLSDEGVSYAEQYFGIEHFYEAENFEISRHVTLALRAHILFEKEKDYVISEKGEVTLLDNGTGRLLSGMKLRGGQHQALETKEKVAITPESRSVASITYQNLFLLFPRFSGMSGTISDAKKELWKIYKKRVVIIPPNKPLQRIDQKDCFFKNSTLQYVAAVREILNRHEKGQPVLVIASTIADAELISHVLIEKQVAHNVLNANNAFWEAEIIREAGKKNAITVSTGMAGRGTDIRLGEGVKELGGLAVIGIGRMANVRLERQARGRAGRQGDPGISKFFVSLEDEVASSVGERILEKYVDQGHRISRIRLKHLINGAQKRSEEIAVSRRESAVDFDKVMKRQRNLMYKVRNRLLDGEGLNLRNVRRIAADNVHLFVTSSKSLTSGDVIRYVLDNISYKLDKSLLDMVNLRGSPLENALNFYVGIIWRRKTKNFTRKEFCEYVRLCALKAVDDAWVDQVDYLQQLQYVVSGRASAQRSPVFEYHDEAYKSYERMIQTIKKDMIRNIFLGEKTYSKNGEMIVLYP